MWKPLSRASERVETLHTLSGSGYKSHPSYRARLQAGVATFTFTPRTARFDGDGGERTRMKEQLRCACEAAGCDRELGPDQLMLAMTVDAGTRRAYECDCGAVTVTVSR